MEPRQEHILAVRLKTIGRFLRYQVGGKAGQQRILMTLLTLEHITQKELQDRLEVSSGAMSEILQKMEEANLIARCKKRGRQAPGGSDAERIWKNRCAASKKRSITSRSIESSSVSARRKRISWKAFWGNWSAISTS